MLHGNILLHGWITGDAPYYTLEVPLLWLSELTFGLGDLALHAASAATYMIVSACAAVVALAGSRGAARPARFGLVVAVLAACLLVPADVWIALGPPDHIGTAAFLLVSVLLVDRARDRRWAAPLLCAVLCAGQLGDVIVRYVYVPAIIAVCLYRLYFGTARDDNALEAPAGSPGGPRPARPRALRTGDAACAVAAVASVPLEVVVREVAEHHGAYRPGLLQGTRIAPLGQWPRNAALTVRALRELFGVVTTSRAPLGVAGAVFGAACLLAALAGLGRVVWNWRTASRAEQILCVAVIVNLGAYCFSTMPRTFNPHEIATVLPCGAVLAARALVPGRLRARHATAAAAAAAAAGALVPLCAAATVSPGRNPNASLITWLAAHRLAYGLSGYWDGSAATVESGGAVALRTIIIKDGRATLYPWMTNTSWFDPAQHDATFVAFRIGDTSLTTHAIEQAFGKPATIDQVKSWHILIYHRNLLSQVSAG
ncbi:MAG TPA: hypothetical protein VK817_04380 [Trebonia sp.]|jgi:hypothetical protein|nr:hypothetical protein [Trebonia sp.]